MRMIKHHEKIQVGINCPVTIKKIHHHNMGTICELGASMTYESTHEVPGKRGDPLTGGRVLVSCLIF
jgi:hypothetical protein